MLFFRGGRRNMKICSYYPFPKSLSKERDLVAALQIFSAKYFSNQGLTTMLFFRGGRRNMKICSYYPFPKSLSKERDLVAVLRNFLSNIFFKSRSNNYALFSEGRQAEFCPLCCLTVLKNACFARFRGPTGRVLAILLPDGLSPYS